MTDEEFSQRLKYYCSACQREVGAQVNERGLCWLHESASAAPQNNPAPRFETIRNGDPLDYDKLDYDLVYGFDHYAYAPDHGDR